MLKRTEKFCSQEGFVAVTAHQPHPLFNTADLNRAHTTCTLPTTRPGRSPLAVRNTVAWPPRRPAACASASLTTTVVAPVSTRNRTGRPLTVPLA